MAFWVASLVGLAIAYLLGSIPAGYLAGRLVGDIDIREHGSGSTGATNVLRVLGVWPALVVFLIDVSKGAVAVLLAGLAYPAILASVSLRPPPGIDINAMIPWAVCLAGIVVLLGHGRSVWLNFTGGKSVATGLGVLLAMSWPVGVGGLLVFGFVLALSRIVSLSSIVAAVSAIILALVFEMPLPYRLLVVAGSAYVILRHRSNMRRLLAGAEPRLGRTIPDAKAKGQEDPV